ncbi:MAG: Yip1 family protein [Chloroflexota bacterium]|nr:Yip1 family protein [Chloroflexota bacterium]
MYEEQFQAYEVPPGDTSPRSFGEIPGLWLKFFQMTESFFAQESPRASNSNTLISIVILSVVTAIFTSLSVLISGGFQMAMMPPEYQDMFSSVGTMGGMFACTLCGGLLGSVVSFYLGNGLIYLGSRIFGGDGGFGTQTYLQSLFTVPIGFVTSLLSLVTAIPVAGPCIGGLVILALSIYAIVLNVRAVKVAHNLTTGKAVAAIFIPSIAIGVIVACLVTVALLILGPTIGNIFQEMTPGMW